MALFCCDNHGAKGISVVRHGAAVKRPCVIFMMSGEEITNRKTTGERSVRKSKMTISCNLKLFMSNAGSVEDINGVGQNEEADWIEELLLKTIQSTWSSSLERFIESRKLQKVSWFLRQTFESLLNRHFEISKVVKKCTVNYLSSD